MRGSRLYYFLIVNLAFQTASGGVSNRKLMKKLNVVNDLLLDQMSVLKQLATNGNMFALFF